MAKKITEVGPKALKGIRNPDLYNQDPLYLAAMLKYRDSYAAFKGLSGQRYTSEPTSYSEETIPYDDPRSTGYSGVRSTFDLPLYIGGVDEQTIQDTRANNQPWYALLGAGIAKGVLTAGTTFLDGTVGLLVGAGSAIANGSWGKFFNNDFSQAMRLFTQEMEKELPNYRTTDEEDNPMAWRNLFTMNTFADDFLKNLGFTVGAFYSGNAFLGALRAVKLGSLISKTAAQTIGSVVSGFNEGRIEAGNLYDETVKEETQKLTEANQRAYDEIQQLIDAIELTPDLLVRTSDGSYYSPKQLQLMELRQQLVDLAKNYDKQVKGILDRAEKAAVADMALNTLYLPLTDMYAYGKLYSRGFKVKKDLAGKVTKGIAETAEEGGEKAAKKGIKEKAIDVAAKQEAEKQALGDRIKKGAKEYITNPVTRKKAAIRGLKTGLSEGAEEINQSMFSSYSGALYSPDSPDAYYQALTNEDYQIKTKDQLTAMTLAMMDSWGNPSTYKEGLVGFMTGILGMPTFGRVNNSDENTYLGKNKAIGLSGGLFGEISRANRLNREAEVAASAMNKLVKKTDDMERFFVRSLAFTDPMEGYSKEGNKFEFENASDNDLFNAIDAFARTGRLSDLRDLVGESFGDIDNLSVEDLKDIAEKTKGDTNEWNNPDGTSMADKPETRPKMQKLLKEKLQKILNAIDSYEDSLEKVRTISNNSLDTDLVAELAWLDWKIKQFENRYKDIKSNNDELFKAMSSALLDYRDELTPDPGYESDLTDEEINDNISKLLKQLENNDLTKLEREDINDLIESLRLTKAAKVELSNTNNLIKFISALQKAKNPAELSAVIESNPTIVDYLLGKGRGLDPREAYDSFDGKLGISFDLYKKAMDELADTAKLSVAYRDFNDRFKEFSSDPIKLIDNRKKIDKKNDKNNKAKTQAKGIDRLNNMSTSEIAEGLRNGDIDEEAAEKALEGIDLNSLEDRGEPNAALKLDLAKKINQAYENAVSSIQDLLEEGTIDELIALDTLNALELQLATAESVEELLDTLGEAFLDPENIDISDLEGMDLDLVEDEIVKRQAAMQNLINSINQSTIEAAEAMADSPTPEDLPETDDIESALDSDTGHDAVDKPKSENHRKEDKQNNPPKKDNKVRTALLLATAVVEYNDIIPEQKGGIINILTKIGEGIDSLLKNGVDEKTMAESVKSWDSYQMLLSLLGDEETSLLLNHYVKLRRTYGFEDSSQQLEETKSTPQKSEIDAPTPDVTQDDISKLISLESNRDLSLDDFNSAAPIYNYWKPTITELPIHRERGSNTPYWELAKTMKKEGTNDPLYTDALKKRMEAVGKYLQKNGAFSRVNSGKVLEKDKIIFITDKTLNEEAGEMVILMATEDTNGGIHVVGDLPSKDEYITGKQSGLPDYIEACEKVLANSGEDETIVILPGETTVKQNMVGKVMYTPKNETHTLNEIHGDLEFKLGVAVTGGKMPIIRMKPGGTRVQGLTKEETGIISPLEGVAGQPFLLMPTSSPRRPYVCVPFFMPKYSELTKNSSLGRAITSILEQISSGSTNADSVRIKNQLGELISVAKNEKGFPEIHINYNGDNVKVTIKPLGSDHQITLYNGNKNNDKMVENIQSKLYGVPFQVNRKYINKDYKGQSYNRMVGELALTNVAVGETHTRSDWFTVNPLGTDLQEKKGSKIKSIKLNPKAVTPASASGATPTSIAVTTKTGNVFYVDPSDWSVYYNGKQFTGNKPGVNKARAIAFGKLNNEDMTKPYDTQWGYYNPVTGNFEQRPDNSKPQEDNIVQFPFDNNLYSVNTDTWLVLDLDNKEYNGPSLNIIRALIYGKIHELLMNKPYETPWGIFDPNTNNFLNEDLFSNTPPSNEEELLKNFLIDEAIKFAEEILLNPMEQWAIDNLRLLSFLDVRKDTRIQLLLSLPDIKSRYEAFQKLLRSNRNQKDYNLEGKKEVKPQEATRNTPQELKDKAKKAGLLNNKNRKALWEVLTTELKLKLVDAFGPKLRQLILALDLAFDVSSNTFNEDALGGSVDLLLNKKALFSKVGSRDFGKKWNQKKELAKMLKMLPQFRKDDLITILKGLIRIADSQNPGLAYGMFQRGVITISDVAASGTVYHEAFHAVFNSLMSVDEREKIMDAAASLYGRDKTYLVLEENLAEDFRKYVLMREAQEDEMREKYAGRPLLGKIMRFFRKLKHLCGILRGREPYINKVFKDIYNGRYARRKVLRYSLEIRYMNELYTPEMRDILKNAPRDSQGRLLAPNGKPSNLTERQYAHVRTKAFKEWFGDWEKLYRYNLSVSEINNLFDDKYNALSIEDFINRSLTYYENERKEIENRISEYPQHSSEWAERQRRDNDINKNIVLLLKSLISHVDTSNLTIQKQDLRKYEKAHNIDNTETVGGVYYGATNSIFFSNSGTQGLRTMYAAHEIIHAITSNEYDNNKQFKKEVDSLYEYIKNIKPNAKLYGLSSPTEMLAEVVNPTFQKMLLTIPSRKNNKSILQEIIDCIKNCFNLKGNRTALEDIIDLIKDNARVVTFNPNLVSKVVDENGEPKPVMHGSPERNISIFDASKGKQKAIGSSTSVESNKMNFFTDDEVTANAYMEDFNEGRPIYGKIYDVFLNIKNPKVIDYRGGNWNGETYEAEYYDILFDQWVPLKAGVNNELDYFAQESDIYKKARQVATWHKGPWTDEDIRIKKVSNTKTTNEEAESALKEGIYDGVIFLNVAEVGQGSYHGSITANDYVTFNTANQVKSATDNVGTYSRLDNDIRYLMVGLKGARSLDTSEEVTLRMDNLNVAREMEEANKDALTIKAATGWERGADGKWRYEIPDITLKKDSFGGREIDAFYGNDKRSAIKRPIEEVFDLSSLPETYREELEAVGEIRIYSDPSDGERGSYATTDGGVLFSINIGSEDESVESIMAHELLHYILEREGFLEGGDLGIGIDAYLKQNNIYDYYQKLLASKGEYGRVLRNILRNDPLYTKYEDISYNLDRVLDLLPNGAYDDLNIDVDKFIKDLIPDWEKGVSYDTLAEQRKEELIKENKKILDEAQDKDDDTERKIEEIRNKLPSSYDAYRRLAGEVESRAAGRRINLTELERRNSLFTQEMYKDVAREDLIFLQNQNTGQLNNIRYNRAEVIEELEYNNRELNRLVKEINRLMLIAKDNALKWHTVNKERWAYLSTTGYLSEDAAEDAIPNDMSLVAEVIEEYGRYYIKYNTNRVLSKIKALQGEIRQNARDINRLRLLETPFLLDNELSDRMLEEQLEREDRQDYLADIAEIRLYHSDKLMYGNLSQEDKDYIAQRKITLEEYNRMSDIEKKTLLECKS